MSGSSCLNISLSYFFFLKKNFFVIFFIEAFSDCFGKPQKKTFFEALKIPPKMWPLELDKRFLRLMLLQEQFGQGDIDVRQLRTYSCQKEHKAMRIAAVNCCSGFETQYVNAKYHCTYFQGV